MPTLTFNGIVAVLDWVGIAVFAITGALVASRKQMDIVGFALLGTVTGIGGGTVRDVVLGAQPVFWVAQPAYALVCVAFAALVFFTAHIVRSRYRVILWLDAAGLALFAVTGAERALAYGATAPIAVIMGVVTATFGGIVRDVIGGETPAVLSPEIYATAALAAALLFVALESAAIPREAAVVAAVLTGFAVRGMALARGWKLPRYRPRPGRDGP